MTALELENNYRMTALEVENNFWMTTLRVFVIVGKPCQFFWKKLEK